ncbi:unnamed protein product [Dibothriocephalus latus]|uniref:Uncharacterized protein n=1 Tax=Dibothriocephalus latus TaxID=60516 RepID=A0A3P7Q8C9_DIBLA|nr:unnamed protein product [Dibothriocephalus latus]
MWQRKIRTCAHYGMRSSFSTSTPAAPRRASSYLSNFAITACSTSFAFVCLVQIAVDSERLFARISSRCLKWMSKRRSVYCWMVCGSFR